MLQCFNIHLTINLLNNGNKIHDWFSFNLASNSLTLFLYLFFCTLSFSIFSSTISILFLYLSFFFSSLSLLLLFLFFFLSAVFFLCVSFRDVGFFLVVACVLFTV